MGTRASKTILLAVLFAIIGQFSFAQDKVPSTPEEKRVAFLTPEYYTNWLGASFLQFRQWKRNLMLPLSKFWT